MRFLPMPIQISKAKKVLGRMIKVSCSRMKEQSKSWHIFWGLWKDGQSIYFSFKTQLQRLTLSLLYFLITDNVIYLDNWLKLGRRLAASVMPKRILLVVGGLFVVTGLICLIIGIVLLTRGTKCEETPLAKPRSVSDRCSYSDEAKRSGLDTFLQKLQDSYFRLHPNKIAFKPGVKPSEIRLKYRAYNPSPDNIKLITDEAMRLLKEVNQINLETHKLRQREKKALAQVKHYLQHVFGVPYDVNYYAGDFLLGPNLWCWQPLCDTPYEMEHSLHFFKPGNTKELENFERKLVEVKEMFAQYRKNMEYGVAVGMVRSVEECKAGINGLTAYFRKIANKGPSGKKVLT